MSKTTKFSKTVHLVLQGKGGVGKSLISSLMSMSYEDQFGQYPVCLDTDPVNSSFASFGAFNASVIKVLEKGNIIARNFDQIIEEILIAEHDVIVDNGASSFIPLTSYLLSNDVFGLLEAEGINVVIHTIIAGGPEMLDTMHSLKDLVDQFPKSLKIILWLNPVNGPLVIEEVPFEKTKIYTENKSRFHSTIILPSLQDSTHMQDFTSMLTQRLTFSQALVSDKFKIMEKHRLRQIQKQIMSDIENAEFFTPRTITE